MLHVCIWMLQYMYVYTQIYKYVYMFLCYACMFIHMCIKSGKSVFVISVYSFRAAYCIGVLPTVVCLKVGFLKVFPFHLYMFDDIAIFLIIFVQSFLGKTVSQPASYYSAFYCFFYGLYGNEEKNSSSS